MSPLPPVARFWYARFLAGDRWMRWAEFTDRHTSRARRAHAAAAALRAGDPGPATALLGTWRFATQPALCEPFLRHLAETPLAPPPAIMAAWLGDATGASDADRPERAWLREREHLVEFDTPPDPLAWALAALSWWGEEVADLERRAWAERAWPAPPEPDARMAGLWAAWFSGDLGRVWKGWEPAVWPAARRALRAALVARRVPEPEHRRIREDTQESLLTLFLGGRDLPPGWREVAVRVVEGGDPDGPITALSRLVEPRLWPAFIRCSQQRQPWRGTLARLHPSRSDAGPYNSDWIGEEPARLEILLDLHAAHRLARAWRYPPSCGIEASWRVLRHHRHRVRGRLRALVRDQGGRRLADALYALDGLQARTEAAISAYIWCWANQELKHRFAVAPRLVTPACAAPSADAARRRRPDDDEILNIEKHWVGLVYLRGKRELLQLYLAQRFKTNGSLGELFGLLPEGVADPDTRKHRTWRALRASLRARLPTYEAELQPLFARLAALDPGRRDLKVQALRVLSEGWPPALPLPAGGFPGLIRHAKALGGAP